MTVYIEYIVDEEATIGEAQALADSLVAELISRGMIDSAPQIHDDLGQGSQYANGPNIDLAVEAFNDCFPCGLDI